MGANKNTLSIYWQQVKKYKPTFFVALFAIPAAALLLDALLPYFLSTAIGSLTTQDQGAVTSSLILAGIMGLVVSRLTLLAFEPWFTMNQTLLPGFLTPFLAPF